MTVGFRIARVLVVAAVGVPVLAAGYLVLLVFTSRTPARRRTARAATRVVQALGPAFVKVGQLVASRRDLLPAEVITELAVLTESVRTVSPRQSRAALRKWEPHLREVDHRPVAAGSIACVYRGRRHDGREVALKIRRPGIDRAMRADLALVRGAARVLAVFLRGVPIVEMTGHVCAAVHGQLDFTAEARSLEELRRNLSGIGAAVVPAVHQDLSTPDCVVMDYVPGLSSAATHSGDLGVRLARDTLKVFFRMLFIDRFVHCDLHPGNLYHTAGGEVVVLDAGFCVLLPERVHRQFTEFFYHFGNGNGDRCAEVMIDSAVSVRPDADLAAFRAGVADLVGRNAHVAAKDFSMAGFTAGLFDLQRSCGLYGDARFVFPLLSILVLEGTLRDLHPELDFQAAATPYLLRAMAK
ncbi:ABC1 kinase family protein [Lentzea sp. HUAS TT2]|uniref:ABC1 kinase family protein n=1 Tax=Lentzea sp. HUAS TT2 TaxID=3447454 RepID=UPI003F725F87